jgi:ABC-type glycerol-3-phosphate transport system permease component
MAVPGHQTAQQTAARSGAGQLHQHRGGSRDDPFSAILAGACVLAAPAIALFIAFQRHFVSTNLGSGVKG